MDGLTVQNMLTIPVLLVVFYFEPALEEIDMADLCFRSFIESFKPC